LALNGDGKRLAKRDRRAGAQRPGNGHGAVTLAELGASRAWQLITESLGWPADDMAGLLERFDPARLPRQPWIFTG
jgi:glutamyl-tRNA synthetase